MVLAWPQKIRARPRWTPRAGVRAQPSPWPVAAVTVVSAERTGVVSPAVVSAVSSARPFSSSWPAGRGRRRVAQLPPANTRASKQFNLELIRINDYKRPNDHGDGRSVWSGAYQISTRGSRAEQTVRREPKGPAGPAALSPGDMVQYTILDMERDAPPDNACKKEMISLS